MQAGLAEGAVPTVQPIVVGKQGQKSAAVSFDGKPLTLRLGSADAPLYLAFGLSSFEGSNQNRCSLDAQTNDGVETLIDRIDKKILGYMLANGRWKEYFAGAASGDQVKHTYRPLKKTSDKWPTTVRTKASRDRVKVWNSEKEALDVERIQKGCTVALTCELTSLYFSAGQWGPILETRHVLLSEPEGVACPF